jgi:hypothetical protein
MLQSGYQTKTIQAKGLHQYQINKYSNPISAKVISAPRKYLLDSSSAALRAQMDNTGSYDVKHDPTDEIGPGFIGNWVQTEQLYLGQG